MSSSSLPFPPLVLYGALGALALVVLWVVIRQVSRSGQASYVLKMRCPACGWSGSHSKYNRVCPACAKPSLKPVDG